MISLFLLVVCILIFRRSWTQRMNYSPAARLLKLFLHIDSPCLQFRLIFKVFLTMFECCLHVSSALVSCVGMLGNAVESLTEISGEFRALSAKQWEDKKTCLVCPFSLISSEFFFCFFLSKISVFPDFSLDQRSSQIPGFPDREGTLLHKPQTVNRVKQEYLILLILGHPRWRIRRHHTRNSCHRIQAFWAVMMNWRISRSLTIILGKSPRKQTGLGNCVQHRSWQDNPWAKAPPHCSAQSSVQVSSTHKKKPACDTLECRESQTWRTVFFSDLTFSFYSAVKNLLSGRWDCRSASKIHPLHEAKGTDMSRRSSPNAWHQPSFFFSSEWHTLREQLPHPNYTREIRKVRFVANFEYVPQVLIPICPYHQKEKAPKIILIICQN